MTGWHERGMAGFDLETTGTDPDTARIVTAAIVTVTGSGVVRRDTWLVNPGIDIPDEAANVHGITTEQARADGMDPAQAAREISDRLDGDVLAKGAPLVIYNAPYDLTVLDRETRRYGVQPFGDVLAASARCVVDPLVLDKHLDPYRRGKRTLTACCDHYQVKLDGAHDAGYDALAAMRCAWRMAATNPHIADLQPKDLHDLQVRAKAAQASSYQSYLRFKGNDEVIDGSWPIKPWTAEAAA